LSSVPVTKPPQFEQNFMFFMGMGTLVAVPVFKGITHLPPFMGILFGLGILWLVGESSIATRPTTSSKSTSAWSRPQADRHELHRLLHRHPAGRGHPGATHMLPALAKWLDQTVGARTSSSP
jgi:hypothetical protein